MAAMARRRSSNCASPNCGRPCSCRYLAEAAKPHLLFPTKCTTASHSAAQMDAYVNKVVQIITNDGRVIVGVHHGARATARKSVAVLCAEPVAVRRTEAVSAFGRLLGRGQLRACERRSKRERRVSRERDLLCDGLLCDVRVRVP